MDLRQIGRSLGKGLKGRNNGLDLTAASSLLPGSGQAAKKRKGNRGNPVMSLYPAVGSHPFGGHQIPESLRLGGSGASAGLASAEARAKAAGMPPGYFSQAQKETPKPDNYTIAGNAKSSNESPLDEGTLEAMRQSKDLEAFQSELDQREQAEFEKATQLSLLGRGMTAEEALCLSDEDDPFCQIIKALTPPRSSPLRTAVNRLRVQAWNRATDMSASEADQKRAYFMYQSVEQNPENARTFAESQRLHKQAFLSPVKLDLYSNQLEHVARLMNNN